MAKSNQLRLLMGMVVFIVLSVSLAPVILRNLSVSNSTQEEMWENTSDQISTIFPIIPIFIIAFLILSTIKWLMGDPQGYLPSEPGAYEEDHYEEEEEDPRLEEICAYCGAKWIPNESGRCSYCLGSKKISNR